MNTILTKEDYEVLLKRKLERLAIEIQDIANAHFLAVEMLKDGIHEGDEKKQEYYSKMMDELQERLEQMADRVEKVSFVYKSMFKK